MNKPLVSILVPVHNNEKFLKESLQSLISQKYRNIEIIAIDDSSSDSSYKILRNFKKRSKKLRIYRNVKRYGIVMTMNRLLRKAKGEFIAFADADDLSAKNRIQKQVSYLELNPNVVALGTQCRFFDEKGRKLGKSSFPTENNEIYNSTLHGISVQFETLMINRNLLPKDILKFNQGAGFFRFKESQAMLIYSDLMIKLLPYGKFANLSNYLHYHRNHPRAYILDLRNNFISLMKLWAKSNAFYDYQPSIRLFLLTLLRTVRISY